MTKAKKTEPENADEVANLRRRGLAALGSLLTRLETDLATTPEGHSPHLAGAATELARAIATLAAEERKAGADLRAADAAARKAAAELSPEEEDAAMLDWYHKLPKARRERVRARIVESAP